MKGSEFLRDEMPVKAGRLIVPVLCSVYMLTGHIGTSAARIERPHTCATRCPLDEPNHSVAIRWPMPSGRDNPSEKALAHLLLRYYAELAAYA